MSDNSSIEWTDASWNPVRGCDKVSAGCKNCYAETFAERWRGIKGHPFEQGFDLRLVPEALDKPLRWRRARKIFVNSMSDLFHEKIPNEYIAAVFGVMAACPRHSGKTRVSIFMPRWASRITLEVTEVRLQRLQDITEEDARAEGLTCLSKDGGRIFKWGIPDRDGLPGEDDDGEHWQNWSLTARDAYARLWDAINGAGSWASNPWVWAISFRRIAQ